MTKHKALQAPTARLLTWIAQEGPWLSPSGQATALLHAAAVDAGIYSAGQGALNGVLRYLEERGELVREVRGRRCFRIAAAELSADAAIRVGSGQGSDADVAAVCGISEQAVKQLAAELEESAPPLVIPEEHPLHMPPERVGVTVEVDPAMARLIFDLVEHGKHTKLIDRDEIALMVERAVNRATTRSAEGMARVMARVDELERQLKEQQSAMRGLGIVLDVAKQNGHKAKPRVNFRMLGVKDSAQRKLLADLAEDGWSLEKGKSGHVHATKDGCKPIELSCTPSDHRTPMNERSRARAAGANV